MPPYPAPALALLFFAGALPSHPQRGGSEAPRGASPPVLVDPTVPQEAGVPGQSPPAARDAVVDGTVHEEEEGGASQELRALAGGPAGFAAVWHDRRDGLAGLYLGVFDSEGAPLAPNAPLWSSPGTVRHEEPAVATGPDGSGLVVWRGTLAARPRLLVRRFSSRGELDAGERPLGGPEAADERRPALAALPDGGFALATLRGRHVVLRRLDAEGEERELPEVLNSGGRWATATGPIVAASPAGDVLCGWRTSDGVALELRRASGPPSEVPSERGALLALAPSPRLPGDLAEGGGWLVLLLDDGELRVRRLAATGRPAGEARTLPGGPFAGGDLTIWSRGVAAVTEGARNEGSPATRRGPIELWLFEVGGAPEAGTGLPVLGRSSRGAEGPRIASTGERLLVAWGERERGDRDVMGRVLGGDRWAGDVLRLNDDGPSADQRHPDVDSRCADAAGVAWVDDRGRHPRAYARVIGEDGSFRTEEIALPARVAKRERTRDPYALATPAGAAAGEAPPADGRRRRAPRASRPAIGLADDGRFLVTWNEEEPAGWTLYAQAFDADGTAAGRPLRVDDGQLTDPAWSADVVALRGGRGYLVAWARKDGPTVARRLGTDGALASDRLQLSTGPECARPAAALLDDNRVVVAWDTALADRGREIRGRLLLEDGRPDGPELRFEGTRAVYDFEPSLAPGPRFGFAMAWTSGSEGDRDVVARVFHRDGAPASGLLALSTRVRAQGVASMTRAWDGSWVVAWEDDLSGLRRVHARRLLATGRGLGPTVVLHPARTALREDYADPALACLGQRVLALWTDVARSSGRDVSFRLLGPGFDFFQQR